MSMTAMAVSRAGAMRFSSRAARCSWLVSSTHRAHQRVVNVARRSGHRSAATLKSRAAMWRRAPEVAIANGGGRGETDDEAAVLVAVAAAAGGEAEWAAACHEP